MWRWYMQVSTAPPRYHVLVKSSFSAVLGNLLTRHGLLQVPDQQRASQAPPEVHSNRLPCVHSGQAVCAEAAHGNAEAAAGEPAPARG